MSGLIIALLVSWVLLKILKIDISVLGLKPDTSRLKNFLIGFGVAGVIAVLYFGFTVLALDADVKLNPDYDFFNFIDGGLWTFRSVLFEELVFRGVLLCLAIQWFGVRNAVILSSFIFGVYHWFSYEVWGAYVEMLYVLVLTGIGGAMFAYAYAVTGSLYLPVGIHFGWNLVAVNVVSEGPLGQQLLLVSNVSEQGMFHSIVFFLLQVLILPACMFIYFRYLKKKQGGYLVAA